MVVMLTQPLAAATAATVAPAMIREPKLLDDRASIGDVRALLSDEHVHAALIVRAGRLLAVVERADMDPQLPDAAPALPLGRLTDRIVGADTSLAVAHRRMQVGGRRRLAVVDADGALIGLLCLKRSGIGFCSEDDVRARAADPH